MRAQGYGDIKRDIFSSYTRNASTRKKVRYYVPLERPFPIYFNETNVQIKIIISVIYSYLFSTINIHTRVISNIIDYKNQYRIEVKYRPLLNFTRFNKQIE